jgi:hypothetical protein
MAYRFLPEEFGFDSVIILFFERISYIMDPPSPTSDNGDHRNLGLTMPCDLRHSPLVPCFRPGTPATFTAKYGILACGGEEGQGIYTKQSRLSSPCNKIEPAASHLQRVSDCPRRTLHVPPCQVLLQFRLTTPLHQSRPTSAFRIYRPTGPPRLRARE